MKVSIGYCNAESPILSLVGECELTMGSFENTRRFSVDKFVVSDEERRGPKARIYLPGLFSWVQFNQAKEIRDSEPDLWSRIYSETTYAETAFGLAKDPTFTSPLLYRHHFQTFSRQFREYTSLPVQQRYERLREDFKKAMEYFEQIESVPIDLEKYSKGAHLQPWLNTINKVYKNYLKT